YPNLFLLGFRLDFDRPVRNRGRVHRRRAVFLRPLPDYWFAPPSREASSCLTTLIGMAKPMPTFPAIGLSIESLTPTTWPWVLSSPPPELPGLIGPSVWMRRLRPAAWSV